MTTFYHPVPMFMPPKSGRDVYEEGDTSSNVQDSGDDHADLGNIGPQGSGPGPGSEEPTLVVLENGITVEVTDGQRRIAGPPEGWTGPNLPDRSHEIFIGKVPKETSELELLNIFAEIGHVWELRLMMNPQTKLNRGFAFVQYMTLEEVENAVKKLNGYQISPGHFLSVTICKPKLRLFVGNIPKVKSKDDLFAEFSRRTAGLTDVIIYKSPDDRKMNRGFCFLEYKSHREAYLAKKRLSGLTNRLWGCDIIIDWADPIEEPDEEVMATVKVLYVRNLTMIVTEERLKDVFGTFGNIERVKKIKDYAFVHFENREDAENALREMDGKDIGGACMEVTWAKPPSNKRNKEEILRARERRMTKALSTRPTVPSSPRLAPKYYAPQIIDGFYNSNQCNETSALDGGNDLNGFLENIINNEINPDWSPEFNFDEYLNFGGSDSGYFGSPTMGEQDFDCGGGRGTTYYNPSVGQGQVGLEYFPQEAVRTSPSQFGGSPRIYINPAGGFPRPTSLSQQRSRPNYSHHGFRSHYSGRKYGRGAQRNSTFGSIGRQPSVSTSNFGFGIPDPIWRMSPTSIIPHGSLSLDPTQIDFPSQIRQPRSVHFTCTTSGSQSPLLQARPTTTNSSTLDANWREDDNSN